MAEPQTNIDLNTFLITRNRELDCDANSDHVKAWLFYKALDSKNKLYRQDIDKWVIKEAWNGSRDCSCKLDTDTGFFGCSRCDADNTEYAWAFYRQLWLDNSQLNFVKGSPGDSPKRGEQIVVQGDWMCSVWRTLIHGINIFAAKKKCLWYEMIPDEKLRKSACDNVGHTQHERAALVLLSYERFKEVLEEPALQKFVREACTLANMVIVPNGFNTARSIKHTTEDYWDLAMYHFLENDCALLNEKQHRKYLAGLLQEMINRDSNNLFLDDWLNKKAKTAKLLPGHSAESPLPTTKDDWCDLVREMTKRIQNRRAAIQEVLE